MATVGENVKAEENLEKKNLESLRMAVNREDPDAKDHDDLTLRRFLRARDLNVDKAAALFLKFLRWRREFVPKGSISESEILNEIAKEKMFGQGFDKKGRPISVVIGARHTCFNRDIDEFKRFLVYVIDKICSRLSGGQEKFVVIGDLQGWGYANCDIRAYLAALEIMQEYYPERLGKVYLVHAPYIFWTAWKMISPFIDNNTKKKIVFVENKRLKETLLEDIDEAQLPEPYGGKLPLVPIHQS
ncbi:uncharacterized protein LOC116248640 [Nymphaea colorata]|nr:uncharacterized protein LOC116248640 [Nymphaea colorata]